ncbi:putative polysaccharide biosynthesis protein [Fervidibacillus halotolerans]|uniref:Polysaccharide biosynthesis protein n=1 Tax=Fervidibacillus halotolerans TaxID=2980027 RepID=A0A9E8LYI9_9BACI|nr:polysaccharide biosynthesis protein [Fervidibacillus halotolerans]WAA11767.1 polysaccharide biosynthesis protein [Fervidibacillus halotolerans]
MASKLLRGTFILTLGTYISKILGLFYVIPFYALVGEHGAALYQYGYVPYTIFLSIGTAGIPLAVSKFISKYNALEEYAVGRKLFQSGLAIMFVSGFISFLTLYMLAPVFANLIIADDDQISTVSDVVMVIRAVSFALIIVPFMSLIRGFFQGHQSMGPSAVSQVIEQIVRITFLLIGVFIILRVMDGTVVEAVQLATFAAFVGAIGSLAILIWYWYKRKPHLDNLLKRDKGTIDISLKEIYKEIFVSAVPFVIVGSATMMFQFVDILTFNRAMAEIGMANVSEQYFSTLNFKAHKIVIIPVSLATAFSLTLVPLITASYVNRNINDLQRQLNQTFQVLLYLTLPASLGISLLSEPMYTFFYGYDPTGFGPEILAKYAPVAVLFALFSVTAAILQGLNEQKFTVLTLLFALFIKLVLNIPLIKWFETEGAIIATSIGYTVAIIIHLLVIRYYAHFRYRLVFRRSILIILFNIAMFAVVYLVYHLFTQFLSIESRIQSIFIISLSALVGVIVYFYLSAKSKLLHVLFPDQVKMIRKRLNS